MAMDDEVFILEPHGPIQFLARTMNEWIRTRQNTAEEVCVMIGWIAGQMGMG